MLFSVINRTRIKLLNILCNQIISKRFTKDYQWLVYFLFSLADSSDSESETMETNYVWYWQDDGEVWKIFGTGTNVSEMMFFWNHFHGDVFT